jgi:hypothetical protein
MPLDIPVEITFQGYTSEMLLSSNPGIFHDRMGLIRPGHVRLKSKPENLELKNVLEAHLGSVERFTLKWRDKTWEFGALVKSLISTQESGQESYYIVTIQVGRIDG